MRLTIEQLIAVYQLEKRSDRASTENLYSQSAVLSSWFELDKRLPLTFSLVECWNDGSYRMVWVSDAERAIATYCEGDFSLSISHSEEEYKKQVQEAHKFYLEESMTEEFTCVPDNQLIAKQAVEELHE